MGHSWQACEAKLCQDQQRQGDKGLTSRVRSPRISTTIKSSIQVSEPHCLRNRRGTTLNQALCLEERHVLIRRTDSAGGSEHVNAAYKDEDPTGQAVRKGQLGIGLGHDEAL